MKQTVDYASTLFMMEGVSALELHPRLTEDGTDQPGGASQIRGLGNRPYGVAE